MQHIVLELGRQALAVLHCLGLDLVRLGHRGEQEDHAQGVVQITQRIRESRVALLDDVVERVDGLVLGQGLGGAVLALTHDFGHLLGKGLVLAELAQDGLVHQVLDVLGIVEGRGSGRALVGLLLVLGLAGVDTLQNAQTTGRQTERKVRDC